MVQKQGRGSSESPWYVASRCLAIINYLQRGAATKQELLTAVYQPLDVEATPAILAERFEKDKGRLRDFLAVPIRYDKASQGYVIGERERPLHYHLHILRENHHE